MSAETVERLFHAARRLAPDERARYLERHCAGRRELHRELEELLAAADAGPGPLDAPLSAPRGAARLSGERVGPFVLEALIAEGGMGLVFRARQEVPPRAVAVKLMRSALASPEAQRRFQHEAELLARLAHPAIAQVYQSGLHALGAVELPWMALELVEDARPITEFAREGRLALRARLELFLQATDALHHAHQRGVLHRDIKPSNVLVDRAGRLRVIDFGVARELGAEAGAGRGFATEDGRLIGTLQYMSPEQFAGGAHALDVRSDVYALGLVLYELLCERLPYRVPDSSLAAAERVVREEPPLPPRQALRGLDADLATILDKALAKEPEQRFESVAALQRDLRHFLRSEPIEARRASPWYVVRKQAQRNPVAVALAGLLALSILGSLGALFVLYRRAERESREAGQAGQLLQQAVFSLRPSEAGDGRAGELLLELERRIDAEFAGERRQGLWLALGSAFESRGDWPRARDAYARAGAGTLAQTWLARALSRLGQHGEARELARRALPRSTLAGERFELQLVLLAAARAERDLDAAVQHSRAAIEALEVTVPPQPRSLLGLWRQHGDLECECGHFPAALDAYERARSYLHLDPLMETGLARMSAAVLLRCGRYAEAAEGYAALERASLAWESPDLSAHMSCNRALCLGLAGRVQESLELFERGLALKRELLGAAHPRVAFSLLDRALVLESAARAEEAARDAQAALDALRATPDASHDEYVGSAEFLLARLAFARGAAEDAQLALARAAEARARCFPPAHYLRSELEGWSALLEYRRTSSDAAREQLEAALRALESVPALDPLLARRLRVQLDPRRPGSG